MNKVSQIEALLFVAGDEGLTLTDLAAATDFDRSAIQGLLTELTQRYQQDEGALSLRQDRDRYCLVTKAEYGQTVNRLLALPNNDKLTQPQLETLVIMAYQQPITRVEVDQIRGVRSAGTIQKLIYYQLVEAVGRREEIGRPIEYATTPEFLDYFGLENLSDLPALPDLAEIKHLDEELTDQDLFTAKQVPQSIQDMEPE